MKELRAQYVLYGSTNSPEVQSKIKIEHVKFGTQEAQMKVNADGTFECSIFSIVKRTPGTFNIHVEECNADLTFDRIEVFSNGVKGPQFNIYKQMVNGEDINFTKTKFIDDFIKTHQCDVESKLPADACHRIFKFTPFTLKAGDRAQIKFRFSQIHEFTLPKLYK
mgnify:CR=1 FL=1